MTSLADPVIAALRSGHDDLATYVAKMDESALTGPSGASEWDVAHVLSHLGSGAEIGLAALERSLSGGGSPPEGFNQSVWARWDAMGPLEHRDGFIPANERLVQRYEGLDEKTRNELRIDLGFLPAPVDVATSGRFRLNEFALHAWDVRAGADPAATLAADAVPLLQEAVGPLLGWISKPGTLGGKQAHLAVDLTDPPAAWGLELGESVAIGESPAQPDGVVRAPAEAWLRLLTGRLAPKHTPAGVEVDGPVTLDDLRKVFPGF